MSNTTKNIFLALLIFLALVGLFLFSINKPLTPIDNEKIEFQNEIKVKDSIISAITEEVEVKDSLLQIKHSETIREVEVPKIITKYVVKKDSILRLSADDKSRFIESVYTR